MNLKEVCIKYRSIAQLSQVEFAYLSQVSLPNLQKIESGKSNPTLETVNKILNFTGFCFSISPTPYNWNSLVQLGLPLSSDTTTPPAQALQTKSKKKYLFAEIKKAYLNLSLSPSQINHYRKLESFQALLLAIKSHYPSFYSQLIQKKCIPSNTLPDSLSGKVIKLRRISLATICEYL